MGPFRSVAAYAPPGAAALGLGMAASVFRPPGFDLVLCSAATGPLTTDLGAPVLVEHDAAALAAADLVLLLPGGPLTPPPAVLDAVRAAHDAGATVAAHCRGVFGLAATGLLDGRSATTHWQHAAELADRHPAVTVRADRLYVDEGRLVTGAGAAAGMDMYLHLVRRDHGAGRANELARLLVVPPHRDGGQGQYIAAPVPSDGDGARLSTVLAWAREHLDQPLPVDALAARAMMSRRSFIRHVRAATGTTPHAWLVAQRLALAEELLETTELPVEHVAHRVGYRSAAVLRERFVAHRGVPPRDYRRTFARR